ncbi:serine hydrolase domain-containing protein [Maricaulis sp.]|uniref:serine hydrolase domain-containing protein n=1 Tax=Maricaulis sp. TaxID=1486257 RepID=UPI00262BF329|nr:serine hydrolase domain-containing protein [Maricaulis sp.]
MLATLFLATVQIVSAQAARPVAEDAVLAGIAETLRAAAGSPGAAVMLWEADTLRVGTAGVRALGEEAAIAPGDLWHIGSNTKSMTATLVARLAERGIVGWDDTIGQHLGGAIGDIHPDYRDLTFRHLLSHRAGLPANAGMVALMGFALQGDGAPRPDQRLAYAETVLMHAAQVEPESGFGYSNAGYVVAGAMLEQATGEDWETLIRREVFDPLGMETAGFGAPGRAGRIDQPRGHRPGLIGGLNAVAPGPRADNPPVMGPAGTVHASMADLARYLDMHLAGARGEATDYLSAESWAILHTPPFGGDYAMGWAVRDGLMMHGGSNTMWLVIMQIDPAGNRAMVAGVNDGRIESVRPGVQAAIEDLGD